MTLVNRSLGLSGSATTFSMRSTTSSPRRTSRSTYFAPRRLSDEHRRDADRRAWLPQFPSARATNVTHGSPSASLTMIDALRPRPGAIRETHTRDTPLAKAVRISGIV